MTFAKISLNVFTVLQFAPLSVSSSSDRHRESADGNWRVSREVGVTHKISNNSPIQGNLKKWSMIAR